MAKKVPSQTRIKLHFLVNIVCPAHASCGKTANWQIKKKLFPPRYETFENSTRSEIVDGTLTFKSHPLNESKGKFCLKEKHSGREIAGWLAGAWTVKQLITAIRFYLLTVELQIDRSYRYRWHKVACSISLFFLGGLVWLGNDLRAPLLQPVLYFLTTCQVLCILWLESRSVCFCQAVAMK